MAGNTDSQAATKILARIKGLSQHLQPDEEPILTIPGIWDSIQGEQKGRSQTCEVILTNQRLIGYNAITFPRERLFLEYFDLAALTTVSLRHKSFEPLFRELLISDGTRRVYIRTSRQKVEELYTALREVTAAQLPAQEITFSDEQPAQDTPSQAKTARTVYGRQDIRTTFERSSLAITLLFVGGLLLELLAAFLWSTTHSVQIATPPFLAGLLAVIFSIVTSRQRR